MHALNYPTPRKTPGKRLRETIALTILLCSPFFSVLVALIAEPLFSRLAPHFLHNLNRHYHLLAALIFLAPSLGILLGLYFLALCIHRISPPSHFIRALIPLTLNALWLLLLLSTPHFHLN